MRNINGIITEVKRYGAAQFSEHVDYSLRNASSCAMITVDGTTTVDMVLVDGASPRIGDMISAELDDDGDFGLLSPDDLNTNARH